MKKQLLIAATAATMSVSALADISITGAASATWTHTDFDVSTTANTNVYAQDFDITITGTSGATTASVSLDIEDSDNVAAGEVKITTSLMGIDLTITDDSCTAAVSGTAGCPAGENVEFIAETEIAGVSLKFEDSNYNANGSLEGAIDVADANVKVKVAGDTTKTTVSGDFGGITASYTNFSGATDNTDYATVEVSGSALNSTVTVTSHSGESSTAVFLDLDGDAAGANESTDASIVKLTTDINGNSVTVENIDSNANGTQKVDKTKISATRALESGADLTATYTNDDLNGKSSVALKIAVSF